MTAFASAADAVAVLNPKTGDAVLESPLWFSRLHFNHIITYTYTMSQRGCRCSPCCNVEPPMG